jgi:hypothetical protein
MPADRCFVGAVINGLEQFYQRDSEQKGKDGKWQAVPYFVLNRSEAITMSEAAAKMFVARLRSLRVHSAFVEDARDGRRIEVASESQQQASFGDQREPVRATLDDPSPEEKWYKVVPVNRPDGGPMWLLKCLVPGVPDPQLMYGKDPTSCLQRALDLNFLQFGERAPAPEPEAPATPRVGFRRRPGDRI